MEHWNIEFFRYFLGEEKPKLVARAIGYEQNALNPEKFVHLRLKKLDDGQIDSFIERWYSQREHDTRTRKTRIKSLKKAIKDSDVGQLARNPLLLTIMALVHKAEADLPKQRVLLYDRCIQVFLVNRNRAKDLLSYDEHEIRAFHEYFGYQMQSEVLYTEVSINN